MRQANYQQTHTNTGETPSNNESNKKQTTIVKEDTKKLLRRKGAIAFSKHKRETKNTTARQLNIPAQKETYPSAHIL